MTEVAGFVLLVARLAIAVIFLSAGLGKAAAPRGFTRAVARYESVPTPAVPLVAATVIGLEIGCGALLFIGVVPSVAMAAAILLLIVFAAAMAANLIGGRRFDCGCGGSAGDREIGWALVARNLLLAAMAAVVVIVPVDALVPVPGPRVPGQLSLPDESGWAALLLVVLGSVGRQLVAAGRKVVSLYRPLSAVLDSER
ncbi:MauE/DoxX family redox-associated membrane protein [Nocardia blacklockiae]|uniref:MauE/DoxX family redox-associated membrane protein n=1 Tax=Nocardia blacklockiae TaxID=480036 RepID=UPI00189638E4|nr:MauE/DoxX family redox-associated membrane protein [Nocardia blacklockiae]MBF6175037.1 DoxX family membrane protein [Nocardia blacklockiae]